jgi:hypothetical protein
MSTAHNVLTGATTKSNGTAREMYDTLVRSWGLPEKGTKDGTLADIDRAREMAREMDPEDWREAYGHARPFLAGALAGEQYERGADDAVDDVLERAAQPGQQRAEIDQTVVQSATPIEVDPEIVSILDDAAPLLDLVTMEAQPGFTAQYNIINDRNAPDRQDERVRRPRPDERDRRRLHALDPDPRDGHLRRPRDAVGLHAARRGLTRLHGRRRDDPRPANRGVRSVHRGRTRLWRPRRV